MKTAKLAIFLSLLALCPKVEAAVAPEYATNTYQNHELSRAEQKCMDEGYKITYASCTNQTAPTERCPHHHNYYKSCSQEQWCRNNNYTFTEKDCQLPLYPQKQCDNKSALYRTCQEDIQKACESKEYTHQSKCQLNDKKCPYSPEYGKCCDDCPNFKHPADAIPEGYVAFGETCTTCDGIVKTNVKPADCEGFQNCTYGPLSPQTSSCLKGENRLYSLCKTAEIYCQENGFNRTHCNADEDAYDCPESKTQKFCHLNCLKHARLNKINADVFGADEENPTLDISKTELTSLVGMPNEECLNLGRPTLTFRINNKNMEQYRELLNRTISNINLNLIFEEQISLPLNGHFKNVKITAQGKLPSCPLKGETVTIEETVSFNNLPEICAKFIVKEKGKLLTSGNIKGDITMEKEASLGIKGNLDGFIKTKSYAEIFIKGQLNYTDEFNNSPTHESVVFGCNSKVKIEGGINLKTANLFIKQWGKLDTPFIKITSTSDNLNLPNTLSSINIYKYTTLLSSYGDTVYPLIDNELCDNKYYQHIGSAANKTLQDFTLEPSNLAEDKWQCKELSFKQQECN